MFNKKYLLILLTGIFIGAIITWAIFISVKKGLSQNDPSNSDNVAKITLTLTPTPKIRVGFIEGSISFPSETIPKDLGVCAENVNTKEKFCTDKQIKDSKFTYGVGYRLEVPEGKYLVYALAPSFQENYKAYYSEFVTCGLSVNCTSHGPITIEVQESKTSEGIDPQDWYNNASPTPTS